MELKIFTDGGSLNNPGQAASAYIIYQNNKIIYSHGEKIGIASNNFAEYTALIKALEKVKELYSSSEERSDESRSKTISSRQARTIIKQITVYADSSLMVNQVNGLFKVKHTDMRDFVMKVRILEAEIKIPIKYIHVLREKNTEADKLVKQALGV